LDKSEEGRQNAAVVRILPFFKVATTSRRERLRGRVWSSDC
jgi:hypothetical protein